MPSLEHQQHPHNEVIATIPDNEDELNVFQEILSEAFPESTPSSFTIMDVQVSYADERIMVLLL